MSRFWDTIRAHQFVDATVPRLVRAVEQLGEELKRYNDEKEGILSEENLSPQERIAGLEECLKTMQAKVTGLLTGKLEMTTAFANTMGINLPDDIESAYPAVMATALTRLERLKAKDLPLLDVEGPYYQGPNGEKVVLAIAKDEEKLRVEVVVPGEEPVLMDAMEVYWEDFDQEVK